MFFNRSPEIIVALELGSSKICVAVGELRPDGGMSMLGLGETRSSGIRKGEIVDYNAAQQALAAAIRHAEENTSATIRDVYVTVGGGHIGSQTVRVQTQIEEDDHLITTDHTSELEQQAIDHPIPENNVLVHALLQQYLLDDGKHSMAPAGLTSSSLEASYHLTYGLYDSLETSVRCVKDLGLEVRGYALASFAAAEAVLTKELKEAGSVVIDMGGGVTDFIVYSKGAVVHTGCIPLGGEHLTNDLSVGLRLPLARAAHCKMKYGCLNPSEINPDSTITLERETVSDERTIFLKSIALIMEARQREVFEMVRAEIDSLDIWDTMHGKILLTGGASNIAGITKLAADVFNAPVQHAHNLHVSGVQSFTQRSDLSAVIGLLRYAQHEELRGLQLRGWARLRHSVRELLSSMNLF